MILSLILFIIAAAIIIKSKGSTTVKERILSLSLLGGCELLFCAGVILAYFGFKALSIVCFALIVALFLGTWLITTLSDSIKQKRYEKQPKHNEKGVVVSAIATHVTETRSVDAAPKTKVEYKLEIKYKGADGLDHTAVTMGEYTKAQVAYICSFRTVPIIVSGDECRLDFDASRIDNTDDEKSIAKIQFKNNTKTEIVDDSFISKQSYIIELYLALSSGVLVGLGATIAAIVLLIKGYGLIFGGPLLIMGLIALVPSVYIVFVCARALIRLRGGNRAHATSFNILGADVNDTTLVEFSYINNNGKIKTATQKVDASDYEKIKSLEKLPIRVFNNSARIEL